MLATPRTLSLHQPRPPTFLTDSSDEPPPPPHPPCCELTARTCDEDKSACPQRKRMHNPCDQAKERKNVIGSGYRDRARRKDASALSVYRRNGKTKTGKNSRIAQELHIWERECSKRPGQKCFALQHLKLQFFSHLSMLRTRDATRTYYSKKSIRVLCVIVRGYIVYIYIYIYMYIAASSLWI